MAEMRCRGEIVMINALRCDIHHHDKNVLIYFIIMRFIQSEIHVISGAQCRLINQCWWLIFRWFHVSKWFIGMLKAIGSNPGSEFRKRWWPLLNLRNLVFLLLEKNNCHFSHAPLSKKKCISARDAKLSSKFMFPLHLN